MSAPDTLAVHAAWADVMADVRELGKGQRNTQQNFNFRGVDDVMNAVGPILRRHRVAVVPSHVETAHRDVQTSNGKPQREATVRVTYTIVGPAGDTITGAAAGESSDSGDKATPKAMSVAFRTFLLQALCLPTQDVDPDQHVMEREREQTPMERALAGIADATTEADVRGWGNWAHARGLLDQQPHGSTLTVRQTVEKRLEQIGSKS